MSAIPAMSEFQHAYSESKLGETVRTLTGMRESWLDKSKFTWKVESAELSYQTKTGEHVEFDRKRVLYRSDTGAPLAVIGRGFKPVQPANVLEFFESVADHHDFKLEMVGEAMGGRMLWGLARTPDEIRIKDEQIASYLMMITGNDGTLATRAFFTSIRLKCTNQLPWMVRTTAPSYQNVREQAKAGGIARMTHGKTFSVTSLRAKLAVAHERWGQFETNVRKLMATTMSEPTVSVMFQTLSKADKPVVPIEELKGRSTPAQMLHTYRQGQGQDEIRGTAWGAVNAVTRYLDHDAAVKEDGVRIARNWIGSGRIMKERALDMALHYADTGSFPDVDDEVLANAA